MLRIRKPLTLLAAGALALTLTACGSETPDAPSGTTSSSTTTAPTTGSSPAPTNSGIVPENTWASVFKKAVPPLASKSDEEVATAAKKVCADFEAAPTDATAEAILQGAQSGLGLDATQAQIFATGAITQFCTPQSGAWTKAAIG
ncbi:hypothetical protein JNB_09874 [Janibacter sp. HTCC2649]|nr:hypothetical protein JNB_09874 [Janibacter sp. HTCC2649]